MTMKEDEQLLFHPPFSAVITGPSCCGKTTLLADLIKNKLINGKIFLFYRNWQPLYGIIKSNCSNSSSSSINFFKYWIDKCNDATDADLDPLESLAKRNPKSTFIFDDAIEACKSKIIEDFFTRISHHCQCNVILITQNLFDPNIRVVTRNASIMIIFKSPRDGTQIRHLAYQMYVEKLKAQLFIKRFREITNTPYGYLFLDFRANTPDYKRIVTDILNKNPLFHCFEMPWGRSSSSSASVYKQEVGLDARVDSSV